MTQIGKRICIIGPSGSGKSTLAKRIGDKLSLPIFHLDQYAHIPHTNWIRRSNEDFQKDHDEIIRQDKWIIEGNYNFLMANRFAYTDTVIFHHFNRFGCLMRFIKRARHRGKCRAGMLNGADEQIKWKIIWHILLKSPHNQKKYIQILERFPHLNVVHLFSFKEIDNFIKII